MLLATLALALSLAAPPSAGTAVPVDSFGAAGGELRLPDLVLAGALHGGPLPPPSGAGHGGVSPARVRTTATTARTDAPRTRATATPARPDAPLRQVSVRTQSGSNHYVDPAVRITLACTLGALFPGLGHAASGAYLYRGLAFSAAFLVSLFGSVAFIMANEEGIGGPHAETGGILLSLGTGVIYVWSLVDALTLAAEPVAQERW